MPKAALVPSVATLQHVALTTHKPGRAPMNLSRRRVLAAGSSAVMAGSVGAPFVARAQQAQWSYKYANNLPDTHPMNVRAREMAAAIKQETNGRFDLQIFPSSQLGSDTDTLSQVRSGGVEFFTLSGLILSTLVLPASINGMGFAFPNYDTVWKAMDGDLGAYVRAQIAKTNRDAGRFSRHEAAGSAVADMDLDVQGIRRRAGLNQLQRSVLGAADQDRRRTRKSTRHHLHRQIVRSAEVLLADQSHVGRLLVYGEA